MSWELHEKELHGVLQLSGKERYSYAIKRIADWEEIWSLVSDSGWVLYGNGEQECVPIWPHASYAESCAVAQWQDCKAQSIPLPVWMDKWLQGIEKDGRAVVVFPTPENKGVIVTPAQLHDDLTQELEQYE